MTDLDRYKILSGKFDADIHKATFTNYLEVVIDSDGQINYANPSHQEYLINYLIDNKYGSRDSVTNACPQEYWFDYMTWLLNESGCVCLWTNGMEGNPNDKQIKSIKMLADMGLYKGQINKEVTV